MKIYDSISQSARNRCENIDQLDKGLHSDSHNNGDIQINIVHTTKLNFLETYYAAL